MALSPITLWQIDGEKYGSSGRYSFLGFQNHCVQWLQSWNSKMLAPWKDSLTNIDSTLKVRDITLLTKICTVKAVVFPGVMYGCESCTIKKAECQRIDDAFELWWCWRRLLRVPWTERRSNHSILKEINPEYSLEGLFLKLKLQCIRHLMWKADLLKKTLILGKTEGRRRREWQRMRCGMEIGRASCRERV